MEVNPIRLKTEKAAHTIRHIIDQQLSHPWYGGNRVIDDFENTIKGPRGGEFHFPVPQYPSCFCQYRAGNPALMRMPKEFRAPTGRQLAEARTLDRLSERSASGAVPFAFLANVLPPSLKVMACDVLVRRETDIVAAHQTRPRSPIPMVPLAISSIRSTLRLAASLTLSSISIRGWRSRRAV